MRTSFMVSLYNLFRPYTNVGPSSSGFSIYILWGCYRELSSDQLHAIDKSFVSVHNLSNRKNPLVDFLVLMPTWVFCKFFVSIVEQEIPLKLMQSVEFPFLRHGVIIATFESLGYSFS